MEYKTETGRVRVNAETAMVQIAPNGTPNIVALSRQLTFSLLDHVLQVLETAKENKDAGLPHKIEISHTWKNGEGTGAIAGGRLTLTLDALDEDEYAAAQAQAEQVAAEAAGQSTNN